MRPSVQTPSARFLYEFHKSHPVIVIKAVVVRVNVMRRINLLVDPRGLHNTGRGIMCDIEGKFMRWEVERW